MADARVPMAVILESFGVEITVTVPDGELVEGTGAWLPELMDEVPSGGVFQRREPRRVLAVDLDEFSALPRGTIIVAPLREGDDSLRWMVDAFERIDADHARLILIEAPEDPT